MPLQFSHDEPATPESARRAQQLFDDQQWYADHSQELHDRFAGSFVAVAYREPFAAATRKAAYALAKHNKPDCEPAAFFFRSLAAIRMDSAQTVRRVVLFVGLCGVFCVGLVCGITVVNAPLAAQLHPFQLAVPAPHGNPAGLARGKFLVAGRHLDDPNFSESVVLLLGYGQQGALGVIINRPTTVSLAEVLPDAVQAKPDAGLVYMGGPVARTAMLLLLRSTHQSDDTELVFEDVYFSGSQMVLQKKIDEQGSIFRMYSGHAGWGPGQLDNEVARGDWHIVSADTETIFTTPSEKIWPALIQRGEGKWVRRSGPFLKERRREIS
jgi:putative transcriptional regulator